MTASLGVSGDIKLKKKDIHPVSWNSDVETGPWDIGFIIVLFIFIVLNLKCFNVTIKFVGVV